MKCRHCDNTIPSNIKFCAYCGTPLSEATVVVVPRAPAPAALGILPQARRGTPSWAKLSITLLSMLGLIEGVAVQFWPSSLEVKVPQQITVGDKLAVSLKGTDDPVMFVIRNPAGVIVDKRKVDQPEGYIEVVFNTDSWMTGNYYIEVRKYDAIKINVQRVGLNSFQITGVAEEPIYDAHFKVRIRQPLGGNFEVEKTVDVLEGAFQYRGRGASGWGTVAIIDDLKVEAHGFILIRTYAVEVRQ